MITVAGYKWEYRGDLIEDLDGIVGRKAQVALARIGALLQKRIVRKLSHVGSGKWYPSHRGDGSRHQASAPGEPPAPDTGGYRDAMIVQVQIFKTRYHLDFKNKFWNKFGRRLELGGSGGGAYIAPRPHIRPVWEQTRAEIQQILDEM